MRRTASAFAAGKQTGIAFAHGGKIIAVTFDTALLAPASLLRRAALLLPDSSVLAGGWQDSDVRSAAVPSALRKHWPVTAVTFLDRAGALDAWYGSLPLYLFVILGPALAGGWLAALLVGAFERQQKAAHAIRNLKTLRPVEARLMVRLAAAERAAAEAARSKSEFTAHMSHELRTPLNAVIGFSEVIGEEFYGPAGHPKYVEYARDIADAGRNLHAKIGDILEFSNIEAGRYPLLPEFVDLAEIASTCVDDQKGRAFSRRVDLAVGFAEPGLVRADPRALKRIFSNLLVNALDYTAQGGRVRVNINDEEGTLVARIADSGAGFSGAEQRQAGKRLSAFRPRRHGHWRGPGPGHRHGIGAAAGRRDAAVFRAWRRMRDGIAAAPDLTAASLMPTNTIVLIAPAAAAARTNQRLHQGRLAPLRARVDNRLAFIGGEIVDRVLEHQDRFFLKPAVGRTHLFQRRREGVRGVGRRGKDAKGVQTRPARGLARLPDRIAMFGNDPAHLGLPVRGKTARDLARRELAARLGDKAALHRPAEADDDQCDQSQVQA